MPREEKGMTSQPAEHVNVPIENEGWRGVAVPLAQPDGYSDTVEFPNPLCFCFRCENERERLLRGEPVLTAFLTGMSLVPKAKLPTDAATRKQYPITTGVLDYFPEALAEVAHCSKVGNDQHNPGQPLHWAKEKSTDHADCITRHLIERGTFDTDGVRHSAKVAWRALALLQMEIENERKAAA